MSKLDDYVIRKPIPQEVKNTLDNPRHYTWHPCGLEAKDIAQEFSYNIGTAISYLWRHSHKNGVEDLEKALRHISYEIKRLNSKSESIYKGVFKDD